MDFFIQWSLVNRMLRMPLFTVANERLMADLCPHFLFNRRPRIAATGGIESQAARQASFSALDENEACHGVVRRTKPDQRLHASIWPRTTPGQATFSQRSSERSLLVRATCAGVAQRA